MLVTKIKQKLSVYTVLTSSRRFKEFINLISLDKVLNSDDLKRKMSVQLKTMLVGGYVISKLYCLTKNQTDCHLTSWVFDFKNNLQKMENTN